MTQTVNIPDITDAMIQQYKDEGYFILEGVLSEQQLALLRGEAAFAVDRLDRQMEEAGRRSVGHQRSQQAVLLLDGLPGPAGAARVHSSARPWPRSVARPRSRRPTCSGSST